MKWFKHETDSLSSEKLAKLIHEFGFEGYGRYWRIMELVAERMDGTPRCGVELPEKEWLRYLLIRRPLFRRYLVVIAQLFDIKVVTTGLLISIEIPNLLKKRDNYTKDLQVTPKKLPSIEVEVEKKKKVKKEYKDFPAFSLFYKEYPCKEAKQDALEAWATLNPDETLYATILEALKKHKTTEKWQKDGGKYIPLPASWIRGRRWEDEISHSNDWRNNPKGVKP